MAFSVVILSKDVDNLLPCISAVWDHEEGARVIVVNDGLPPFWQERLLIRGIGVAVNGEKPFIFARNANIGIREAGADDVILLNDDALLQTPGGFQKLADFAETHPEVGVVAPATNVTGQPLQWRMHRTPDGWRYVEMVPYIFVYLPRRTLDKIGLLDERYCLDYGCEDNDHIEAQKRAGLKAAILYDVFVDHGSLKSSFRGDPSAPKSFARNYELFKQKWGIA